MGSFRPPGMQPLPPRRKWRAITIATLVLVPAFLSLMGGLVALATDEAEEPAGAPAAVAFGLALLPFVFVALAFLSEHPRAPAAVVRAMGLSLLVGLMMSAFVEPVTGVVAGMGAGGIVALRMDDDHTVRSRIMAVVVASAYTAVLVLTIGGLALLPAPIFPFTALGVADHMTERRAEAARAARA
jgi:hypothetical protein